MTCRSLCMWTTHQCLLLPSVHSHPAAVFAICSYMALVSQFSAVSYGDILFASVILLPLQQCCPVELRRLVWDEQAHVLRALSLPLEQVSTCVLMQKLGAAALLHYSMYYVCSISFLFPSTISCTLWKGTRVSCLSIGEPSSQEL